MKTAKTTLIDTVLFDFDGTLTMPGAIDFEGIKKAVECPSNLALLEYIETLDPNGQLEVEQIVTGFELEAAGRTQQNPDLERVLSDLRSKGLKIGILTRNSMVSVNRSFENFTGIKKNDFDIIISRDDPVEPKPSAEGIILAAKKLNTTPDRIIMVGDYLFDIEAGENAGSITVFLDHGSVKKLPEPDFVITELTGVIDVVRKYIPLRSGKIPNDLLDEMLSGLFAENPLDPSILIPPGIGEDVTAVDINNAEVLVLKSDPITFATDAIGRYAVLVNANDIATSGAAPRWFLTTLLFPPGTSAAGVYLVMNELAAVCREWNITLSGGHTEITDAVTRPVITGMLAGTIARKDLVNKRNMRTGDCILMTKSAGVEGTSIVAREFGNRLLKSGMPEQEIEQGRAYLANISILKEAQIAGACKGVTAMHDVTEGGVATAIEELGIAGNHSLRIDPAAIPVSTLTGKMCRLLGISPLGLIGSGSLLICCEQESSEGLISEIRAAGIEVSRIGEVLDAGKGLEAVQNGEPVSWPKFEVDEIARLFG
ncbi:MAG: HAD-IA family hydrolase [bacterium]|nr:HAD-IA family hydrolase [bacterium]